MKKILLFAITFLFLITFVQSQPTTGLVNPTNGATTYDPFTTFNFTAVNGSAGEFITLINLYTNNSGSWALSNSTTVSGNLGGTPYNDLSSSVTSKLYAFWKLDNNDFTSETGNSNGTNYGTTNTSGIIVDGRTFDGVNDRINAAVAYSSSHVSVGGWLRTNNPSSGTTQSFYRDCDSISSCSSGDIILWQNSNVFSAVVSGCTSLTVTLDDTEWHHVVFYYDESNQYLWFDGELQTNSCGQAINTGGYQNFGATYTTGVIAHSWWNGTMDELVSFASLPTDSDVQELYNRNPSYNNSINFAVDEDIIWNVEACDNNGDCSFAASNYTLFFDNDEPTINVFSPLTSYSSLSEGDPLGLNFTVNDTNLDSCWYDYNGTTVPLTCNTNTTFNYEVGNNNVLIYANDTLGNLATVNRSWDVNLTVLSESYNPIAIEKTTQTFSATVLTTLGMSSGVLQYNGVNYTANIYSLGGGQYQINTSLTLPDVVTDTNYTFEYYLTLSGGNSIVTSTQTQLVKVLDLGSCSTYNYTIFNLSLYDERTLASIYGSIEVGVEIFNAEGTSVIQEINTEAYNVTTTEICSSVNLTEQDNLYSTEIRYYSDLDNDSEFSYVPEFYHIQKAETSNLPQSINLYDLSTNESTEFTISYRDNNYLPAEGVLLQIQRAYIGEGVYRTVEIPITGSDGRTIGHFDLNNYKYRITATKDGEVLNTFENVEVTCENELSAICTITLSGVGSPTAYQTLEQIVDISYSISLNDTEITLQYTIPSGETRTVNVVMTQVSPFTDNNVLCNSTIISSSGSFTCEANATIGDSQILVDIIVGGQTQRTTVYYAEDLGDFFLLNNYVIAALLLTALVTMMISSPKIMVLASVFGVAFLGLIFLLKGSSIGTTIGSIGWLILVGLIIMIKINQKDET